MSQVVVGVADCKYTKNPGEVLVTYALGSCIALMLHDPVALVGGLLHYMLPDSGIDKTKARQNPWMFADTGVPALLGKVQELGAQKRRLTVQVAGGAQVLDANGYFNIGKRNYLALRKLLWKSGLMIHAESVGGMSSRTVRLSVATGKAVWREPSGAERTLNPARTRGGRT